MSTVIVVAFQGKHRAADVLSELERLNEAGTLVLDDAIAVYRTHSGHLRTDYSMNTTKVEGGVVGGVLGTLVGAIIALPFTAGASAAVAASTIAASATMLGGAGAGVGAENARTSQNQHGIPEEVVEKVAALIQPGSSAVFVEARADPAEIAKHFDGYGGKVLSLAPFHTAETTGSNVG